jgi:hypothetical protein
LFSPSFVYSAQLLFKTKFGEFQDGGYREEAESEPPIVKSWRDTGDTPCRQNHQEEAKL